MDIESTQVAVVEKENEAPQPPSDELQAAAIRALISNGSLCIREARRLGVDKDPNFVPATAAYLNTQHAFARIDPASYTHPDLCIDVKGHLFGPCIHCGRTFEDMAARPDQDAIPSLYYCAKYAERRQKSQFGQQRSFGARRGREDGK